MATGVPFNWKDMTPVSMMALDQFVLWVNAEKPYKTASDYIAAVKAAGPNKIKMGGTGSKQEDQILTVGIEKATGTKFIYVPYKGGGEVAVQLVGKHIDSTVNNPIEAVAQWRAGQLRPLCVFDDHRMPYKAKVTDTQSWGDIPTCKESGVPTDYVMLRGIFMPPGVTPDQVAFYVDLLKKVRETPDWKDFMEKGAFNTTSMSGAEFRAWLEKAESDAQAADDRSRLPGQVDDATARRAGIRRRRRSACSPGTAPSTPSSRRCCSSSAPSSSCRRARSAPAGRATVPARATSRSTSA